MSNLYVQDSAGGFVLADDKVLFKEAASAAKRGLVRGTKFKSHSDIKPFLVATLAGKPYEVFCVAFLDGNGGLLSFDEMFRGTINQVPAYVREIMKRALELNAEHIIVAHCHPSGNREPSTADIMVTIKLGMVGAMLDIGLADHFIVAGDHVTSIRDTGALNAENMKVLIESEIEGSLKGATVDKSKMN